MPDITYPYGYGRTLVTMTRLREIFEPKMHPEFARRLFNWIESGGGQIGIGGGWRATGEQPDKPGFAPEGRSFHQYQQFPSGQAYAAVDLVARNGTNIHRAPYWSEVPLQGSADAAKWGVHANVGTPTSAGGESWHLQPVEIDGHATWVGAGRPDLKVGYPIPGDPVAPVEPLPPTPEEPTVTTRYFNTPASATALWKTTDGLNALRVELDEWIAAGTPAGERLTSAQALKFTYYIGVHTSAIGLS